MVLRNEYQLSVCSQEGNFCSLWEESPRGGVFSLHTDIIFKFRRPSFSFSFFFKRFFKNLIENSPNQLPPTVLRFHSFFPSFFLPNSFIPLARKMWLWVWGTWSTVGFIQIKEDLRHLRCQRKLLPALAQIIDRFLSMWTPFYLSFKCLSWSSVCVLTPGVGIC